MSKKKRFIKMNIFAKKLCNFIYFSFYFNARNQLKLKMKKALSAGGKIKKCFICKRKKK